MNLDTEQLKKKAMEQVIAAEARRKRGIIIRTIALVFKTRWFKIADLKAAISGRDIDDSELYDILDYFEDKGIIRARNELTKNPVEVLDADQEDDEVKLTSKGTDVIQFSIPEPGIDL